MLVKRDPVISQPLHLNPGIEMLRISLHRDGRVEIFLLHRIGQHHAEDVAQSQGRTEPGVWSLPDGSARYAAMVKRSTTTNLTPEDAR